MAAFEEDWQMPGHWFDYYQFMGLKLNATDEEIKKSFKNLARKYHPDNHLSDDEKTQKEAEDNFKKLNTVYEILSKKEKRKAYDADYINRTRASQNNTNNQHSNNQSTSKGQGNYQKSTTNQQNNQNTSNNQPKTLDDIINDYNKNPNDKKAEKDLKQAFNIIIESIVNYSTLTDEAYKEFYENIYNNSVDENTFLSTRDDLILIIKEQQRQINEFEQVFNNFTSRLNMYNEENSLYGIQKEYERKIQILSKNYYETLSNKKKYQEKEIKKYYYNNNLLTEEFIKKLEEIDKKLPEIIVKSNNEDKLLEAKSEILSLLDEYNNLENWLIELKKVKFIFYTEEVKRTKSLLQQYIDKIKQKQLSVNDILLSLGDVDKKVIYITAANNLIKSLENFITELKEYDSYLKMEEKINNGTLNEANYELIKSRLMANNKDLIKQIDELTHHPNISKNKKDTIFSLKNEIYSLSFDCILLNRSYDQLISSIKRNAYYEKQQRLEKETETKAQELQQKLKPITNSIFNMFPRTTSYYKMFTSKTYKDIDENIKACKTIIKEMEHLPLYEKRKDSLFSYVYGLYFDSYRTLKLLEDSKKLIRTMSFFEDWVNYCKFNMEELNGLYNDLKKSVDSLIENENQDDKTYKDIISKINILLQNSKKKRFDNGIFLFNDINGPSILYSFDDDLTQLYRINKRLIPRTKNLRIDTKPYKDYKNLEDKIKEYMNLYTPEYIKNIRLQNKITTLKKTSETVMSTLESLLKENYFDYDWKEIIHNKNLLANVLEDLNKILSIKPDKNNNEEHWKFYQEIKMYIEKIPSSTEELIEALKLETLDLFKKCNDNKKKIYDNKEISNKDLNEYINDLYNYQNKLNTIKCLKNKENISKANILENEIIICNTILEELNNLRTNTNIDTKEQEEIYSEKIKKLKKELFYIEHQNCNNVDLLWELENLKNDLETNPLNEETFMQYLDILGKIKEKEHIFYNTPCNLTPLTRKIVELEAKKVSLLTQKQAINDFLNNHGLNNSFLQNEMSSIESDLNSCIEEINILKL